MSRSGSTLRVTKTKGSYPRLAFDANGGSRSRPAGGVLPTSPIHAAGIDAGRSAALAPWRPVDATHDPAKVLLDLASTAGPGVGTPAQTGRPGLPSRRSSGRPPRARLLSRTIACLGADVDTATR